MACAKDLNIFKAFPTGTTSWYPTGESPPIKAGHRETLPHLDTTCTRFNTSAWRSTRPSVGPERSQLLRILPSLTVRRFFSVSAYFSCCANIGGRLVFSMRQGFSMRQCFLHFFWRLHLCILPTFLFSMCQ